MPNTIADNLQRLIDAKDDIADAITAKGGTVASGDGFEAFSADIATIPSGGGGEIPKQKSTEPALSSREFYGSTWSAKSWSGLTSFTGSNIWTNGDNIYYSNGSTQYVLNKSTSTWSEKSWSGLTSFSGDSVWTDGDNIYYSSSSNHYVLNKSTSTWSVKTWSGLSSFDRDYIWTDGDNIYYSSGSNHYVLNKSTSTWSTKSWSGLTDFTGGTIWTDGDNIYYSYDRSQYVLDKSISTWSTKSWSGLTRFYGYGYIWTDGDNIYYSLNSNQYVLDEQVKPTITILTTSVKPKFDPWIPTPQPILTTKSITSNGTYNASSDNADGYSSVVANVPNTYVASDEGKVVSNGALVAQGSDTVTQNGTVDTTMINSLVVNVSGGGSIAKLTPIDNGNIKVEETEAYLIEQDNYIYFVGSVRALSTNSSAIFSVPLTFDLSKIGSRRNESTRCYQSSSGAQSGGAYATIDTSAHTISTSSYKDNYVLTFFSVAFEKSS